MDLRGENCLQNAHFYKQNGPSLKAPFQLDRSVFLRGPQMGGQIRRGRIWRFWGAPIFSPESPNTYFQRVWGPLDGKSGRPKNAKFNHDGSDPPFAAL